MKDVRLMKRRRAWRRLLTLPSLIFSFIFINFSLITASAATTIESANVAYQSGNYQQAITLYQQALKAGHSAELYYNLGNAYYRIGQTTEALINYERAYLYDQTDPLIKHNLDFVRAKTKDKLIPAESIFFVNWYKQLVYLTSVYGWAIVSLVMIAVSLLCLLGYLFTSYLWQRKLCFWSMLVAFLLFIVSVGFALQQRYYITHNTCAIVAVPEVHIKKAPEEAAQTVATIHEGTHIDIIDNSLKDWKEIELPDGKTGWIRNETLIKISTIVN